MTADSSTPAGGSTQTITSITTTTRSTPRKTHLSADTVPVEKSLLARAGELEREVDDGDDSGTDKVRAVIAVEFRALAEELHYH